MSKERTVISKCTFDEERALYNLTNADVIGCTFAGPLDGESVLKEARDISIRDCTFSLRYPMWHDKNFTLKGSSFDELARAAIWYARNGRIEDCNLHGIKAIRECRNIALESCSIDSPEFGWVSSGITMKDCTIESQYLFLNSKDVKLSNVRQHGKYDFQYMENLKVDNCEIDTKDAFWHSKNVTVRNSIVKGQYLGWFSEGLTLIDCEIEGTQPLCYCKNLKLVNCTMKGCDLSFEYSQVDANVRGHIDSVKNPKSGRITADSIGEVIWEDSIMDCSCEISAIGR